MIQDRDKDGLTQKNVSEIREIGQNGEATAPYKRVAMSFFDSDGSLGARLMALCAEPGMGCADVITAVLAEAACGGARVVRHTFRDASPESASRTLTRLARTLASEPGPIAVGLDELPPSDEACVLRQARALRKMWAAGISVLFSVCPEGRQLIEQLPECVEIPPTLLLVRPEPESDARRGGSNSLLRLSRGIPALVRALEEPEDSGAGAGLPSPEYYDALGELMRASLRPTLPDEERRLRLAMLLLGKGTRYDLGQVLGTVSDELLDLIRAGTPLFGVSRDLMRFSCLTAVARGVLVVCLRRVAFACTLFPDVAASCMSLLVDRNELERAAALATLPECAPVLRKVLERGAEFLDIGEVTLVLHATEHADDSHAASAERLAAAARALSIPKAVDDVRAAGDGPESEDALRLFLDVRRLIRGEAPLSSPGAPVRGRLEGKLATHLGACTLMLRGAFSTALTMLVGSTDEGERGGVSGALLVIDREVARLMTGGRVRDVASTTRRAEEFIRKHPLRGLVGYVTVLRLLRALLSDGRDALAELDGLATRYERANDALVQAVALVCGAIADLRADSPARARIRASLAESLARGMGLGYLRRVAVCIGEVAATRSGEGFGPVPVEREDDLDSVRTLVRQVALSEGETLPPEPVLEERVPWDALWLLRVLCTGMGAFSANLIEAMPHAWRRVASANGPLRPRAPSAARTPAPEVPGDRARARRPIELCLLGGFALSVHGVRVPDWRLERRNAKSMLEYLVLHGGSAKRYQLVDQVWPDSDYAMGFNRAYQTTSVLRAAVAEIDPELSLVSANRTSGEIAVDMGSVSCDVDAFREAAREAVDGGDDERKLEYARLAERIYVGDLYVPTVDSTGFIASLRAILRDLYADAMVEGSAAALRLGYERTAARLAENAIVANELREDANAALVRALRACGRGAEADRRLRSFEARLRRGVGDPSLRRLPSPGPDQAREGERSEEGAA